MGARGAALFGERPTRDRWTGSTALVTIPTGTCPVDGQTTTRLASTQVPLLRHGGYGAGLRTVRDSCECGWALVREVSEVNPR